MSLRRPAWVFFVVILFVFAGIQTGTYSKLLYRQQSIATGEGAGQAVEGTYGIQWEQDYGTLWWWSARYEGPQPVGDADNDGKNELLIGGRDPFMRVMKWDETQQTYYEQQKIIDPVFGIGYGIWVHLLDEYH